MGMIVRKCIKRLNTQKRKHKKYIQLAHYSKSSSDLLKCTSFGAEVLNLDMSFKITVLLH